MAQETRPHLSPSYRGRKGRFLIVLSAGEWSNKVWEVSTVVPIHKQPLDNHKETVILRITNWLPTYFGIK